MKTKTLNSKYFESHNLEMTDTIWSTIKCTKTHHSTIKLNGMKARESNPKCWGVRIDLMENEAGLFTLHRYGKQEEIDKHDPLTRRKAVNLAKKILQREHEEGKYA